MKFRTSITAACTGLAFVVAGSALTADVRAQTVTPKVERTMPNAAEEVSGIKIPDSKLARDAAQLIRDAEGVSALHARLLLGCLGRKAQGFDV